MESVLIAAGNLPFWAISAIVGGLFGAVGALVGAILAKSGWATAVRIVPIVALAASFPVTKNVIAPAILQATLNQGLPKKVDEITILESTEATTRGLAYHYKLLGDIPSDFSPETIKTANLAGLCQNWKSDFDASRATQIDYIYSWSGGDGRFSISPSDCK